MQGYIQKLIEQGEHQQLDFKFEISDSQKIARSLVAFANTDGGRLLIGVKDNGVIAGVRSEEEYYMVEAAAKMYTKPEVPFTCKEWHANEKTVLEIIIPKSEMSPHFAKTKEDKWLVYIRVNDQNFLANSILLKVWQRQKETAGVYLKYSLTEKLLLQFLTEHSEVTLSKICKDLGIYRKKTEKILIDLILLKIVEMRFAENGIWYKLSQNQSV
ncbi:MAG TPA: ATP-binding protein [Bacteroidales bacterium]|nr:ATP-binding protein [Bacteroidales bacterium]